MDGYSGQPETEKNIATTRGRDIVVVAASAGGVEALRGLLSKLPVGIPATLLVVLHVPAAGGKVLPKILGRAGLLPAGAAADGEAPLPGHVYVAPPDCHLLLVGDKIRLSQGPRHNGHRPAADPLFISAALSSGSHTIAVVLSGTLNDGAAGAAAVERRGGLVVIQNPSESAYDGMPRAAMAATRRSKVLRLAELAAFIDQESRRPVSGREVLPDPDLDRQLSVFLEPVPRPAAVLRLEERSRLHQVLAKTAEDQGYPISAGGFRTSAQSAHSSASQIRKLLESPGEVGVAEASDDDCD